MSNNDPESFTKADILNIVQQLASVSPKVTPTKPTHLIKIAEPGRFSGQRDIAFIDAWFLSMERYLGRHYQVDPLNWVPTAIHFLDGRVILWWNRLEKLPSCPTTWNEFKERISNEFKPLFAHVTARDRFAVLKQGTSSAQDYVHAMQDILLEAADISGPEAIDHFVRNLKPQLYAKVRGTRSATLEVAFKAAFDEETCILPPETMPSSIMFTTSNTSAVVDDPMDLSVAFTTLYCEWCRRKVRVIEECRTKASAIDKFVNDYLHKNPQNTQRFNKRCK